MLTLTIKYTIPPDAETWVDRIEAGCVALEQACPPSRLTIAMSGQDYVPDKAITDRPAFLRKRLRTERRLLSLHDGQRGARRVQVSGSFDDNSRKTYTFSIRFQTQTWEECEGVLAKVGDAVGAYTAAVTPSAAATALCALEMVQQGGAASAMPHWASAAAPLQETLRAIDARLPALYRAAHFGRRDHPAQPEELGWLNYWSADTCRYLGFPDELRDKDLLQSSRQTVAGAWVIRICAEPLEIARQDHVRTLVSTYERFPKLGIRTQTRAEPATAPAGCTVYVNSGDAVMVATAIRSVLAASGWANATARSNGEQAAVTIHLVPGAHWIALQTSPGEFLASRASAIAASDETLLQRLCKELACSGFLFCAYNDAESILLEADARGTRRICGFRETDDSADSHFHGIPFANPSILSFELNDLAVDVLDFDGMHQISAHLAEVLTGSGTRSHTLAFVRAGSRGSE